MILDFDLIEKYNVNLSNIPHLDDAKILYRYRNINTGMMFPVYFKHGNRFISKTNSVYTWHHISPRHIKDNTLINTKLLDNI